MKIICPGHVALIDIPQKELREALHRQSDSIVFNCSVCAAEVRISDIRLDIIYEKLGKEQRENSRKKVH